MQCCRLQTKIYKQCQAIFLNFTFSKISITYIIIVKHKLYPCFYKKILLSPFVMMCSDLRLWTVLLLFFYTVCTAPLFSYSVIFGYLTTSVYYELNVIVIFCILQMPAKAKWPLYCRIFIPKNGLVRTRRGSYYDSDRRFFCRRWLPSSRCRSRRSLLRCCRFNAGRRVLQGCRNNCNITTLSCTKHEFYPHM